MNESVNGNNENEEKLIINIGEAYRPVVEDYERAKESMFKPIYEKGRNLVKEICEAYDDKNSTNECNTNIENYNNIIAFIGERGSGKTSSMLTFSDLLNDTEFLRNGLSKKAYDKDCIEFKFVQSDVIDPSQFDKNVNILEIILAGMFKIFKNKADKIESTDRQKIIECFDNVYRNLKTLKKESSNIYDGEVLEALIEMSASMEIKENLSKLIAVYLEKVENENNEKSIFVVKIDDIDLNTEHAHSMVEQLRKYLMLPRVIILMALKMDQLNDVVNQTHYKSLAALSRIKNINNKVVDMTEKYLNKLFPIDHRLLMPEPAIFSSSKKFQINIKIENNIISEEYPSLDYGIRELIYKKTGLHFIKPDKNENPIVPSNLRELVNFVHYLQKFENIKITSKEKLIRSINAIIGNGSSKKELDNETKEKLQANGKSLEDFSWLLDCPLSDDTYDWEILCTQNKKDNSDDLTILDIKGDIFTNLKNELNLINDYENNNIHVTKKQLLKFKNYFLSYWCQNKIYSYGQLLITRFLELDNKRKNKFIVSELEIIFKIIEEWEKQRENMISRSGRFDSKTNILQKTEIYIEEYKKIYSVINYDANISIGDVLLVISMLEKLNVSNEVQNLIFAIKTIYYIELELLNLSKSNRFEKCLFQESENLIGGEYFSSFQKQIISDEKISGKSRCLRNGNIFKIREEAKSLEYNQKIATILFMNLMFSRTGNINENYRINDEIYYDFYDNLNGRQENYVLSITSPFFNSYRVNQFMDSKIFDEYSKKHICSLISINNMEKCISNIILLEYLFIENIGDKKLSFTNPENITTCWHEFYESLNYKMRFFDGISYFSIFNMNFMKVFRRSDIKNINISEDRNYNKNIIDKLIESMKADERSRKSLQNYWIDHYLETKKYISSSAEIRLDTLNNYITEMKFFKLNRTNTSFKMKQDLIDILESLSFNKFENMDILLKRKEEEWFEKNPKQKNEYAEKIFKEANYFYDERMYIKAIELFNEALQLNPYEISYLNNLGRAYNHLGKLNNDVAFFNREIETYKSALNNKDKCTKKELCVISANLSRAYVDRNNIGDIELAFELANEAINIRSDLYYGYYSLAKVYKSYGKYYDLKKSIDNYEIALNKVDITAEFKKRINDNISKCREELESIESQTEEPQETNLEDSEPKDNE